MSRCVNGVLNGVIDGLLIGFVVGATICYVRSCHGRAMGPILQEGGRWASGGAIVFGAIGTIRHCL